ncbi:MAG TPA: Dyp-type peroxidase [Candidatus Angelobacter sp.]|nr:Dyp-type peroxidase [Candidatus Angelobacter sp.]
MSKTAASSFSRLDETDIQGFVLRGYTFPVARYLFLEITDADKAQRLIGSLIDQITTGEHWDQGKPDSTLNIAFTYKGLTKLDLPDATLLSFPVEFFQGMKARAGILCDTGKNASEHWDPIWHEERAHVWLGVYAQSFEILLSRCATLQQAIDSSGGARVIGAQDAGAIVFNGKPSSKEHFGYTDGFGNPDFLGVDRDTQPGQGKLMPDGTWAPLATGELLLGYADEAGELPVAPVPHILANNGTFMVYRKLHQNVKTFRDYLEEKSKIYPGGKEKLAAKFIGRWRDGTPIELSPDRDDHNLARDKQRNVAFTYGGDLDGKRCPVGAHIRRTNPRDAFGFNGGLINRRRITRRGLPYGTYVPEGEPVTDDAEHGIIFMALNASLFRQFEFVQQQWIEYGNDAHQGNDKDMLIGNHGGRGRYMIQGTDDALNPPFMCGGLPNFVELRGGDYFFVPSITALRLIAAGAVDPR